MTKLICDYYNILSSKQTKENDCFGRQSKIKYDIRINTLFQNPNISNLNNY